MTKKDLQQQFPMVEIKGTKQAILSKIFEVLNASEFDKSALTDVSRRVLNAIKEII